MFKHFKAISAITVFAGVLTGCSTLTPTTETQESYAIYDIKKNPNLKDSELSDTIRKALQSSLDGVRISRSIPQSPLPEEPSRFKLEQPLQASHMSLMAASAGISLRSPTCEHSILTANASHNSMSSYGESTSFFLCLIPYQSGYHLNLYSTYTKSTGGFGARALGHSLARAVVGDTSSQSQRTFDVIVEELKKNGAQLTLVEAFPSAE